MTVRSRRCRDCAFHPESPENEFGSAPVQYEGASIVQLLEMRLRDRGAAADPFFCHDNLPCVPNDGWRAATTLADEPAAAAAVLEVCAGWAAAYQRVVGEPL